MCWHISWDNDTNGNVLFPILGLFVSGMYIFNSYPILCVNDADTFSDRSFKQQNVKELSITVYFLRLVQNGPHLEAYLAFNFEIICVCLEILWIYVCVIS